MAKAWKDVIASQQYQALAPEQRAQAQEQYFNEVVAPQAGSNAEQAKQAFYSAYPRGLLEKGNIDIHNRPVVHNADGTISTVRTISINDGTGEVLIPTVSDDGRIMSDREAMDTYGRTGKHFGKFDSPEDATAFAQNLHNEQAQEYGAQENSGANFFGNFDERQPVQQQQAAQQQGGFMSDLGNAAAETGRGLLQAGVNLANIPASMADAVVSAGAWAGNKLGLGDGTYQPAPRVTTEGLAQEMGLQQGALTPQTTEGKIFAEALPYLTPVGAERIATQAPTIAGRVAQGASRLLAENAVGSLAANSEQNDPSSLATDLGAGVVLGGATNQLGRVAGAAYRGVKGAISPEAQQAIRFANSADVPLHTTDVLQPNSRVGRMAQTTAENIPFAGTSTMRANQQEARSQLVDEFASRFGEYDPSIVVGSLKSKSSGIRRAAGNRLEQVQSAMAGVNIKPNRAIQQIDKEIADLQKLGGAADTETISKLKVYRDELSRNAGASGPMAMDLSQLSALRSQFRQDVKGERQALINRSEAAVNRVYSAMTGDIDNAIGTNLGNDTLRRYKQANAIYADEANKLQNTRLKNVIMKGDLTPEVVNNMLFSKNKSEVQNLYNSVGQIGRAQMRNGIIGKAMEKSGGSPDQFLRQVNLMSNQTGIAFKGRDAAYLKGLKNYLESTKRAGQAGVTTPTGQQAIPFIMGIGTVTNPALIGVGGGYGLLARMYESEPARNAMLRLANTPRGSTAFEKALSDVERVVNSFAQGAKSEALSE